MLEAEAAEAGQSISQIAETLLKLGLEIRRQREFDHPIQALSHLMSGIAYNCIYVSESASSANGRMTLSHMTPSRARWGCYWKACDRRTRLCRRRKYLERIQSSSELADQAFTVIWRSLHTSQPTSVTEIHSIYEKSPHGRRLPEATAGALSRGSHAMDRARRALIKAKGDEK